MQQENIVFRSHINDLDEDLNINLEKYWKAIWSNKLLLIKVFCSVLLLFILLTFILPKKYKVTADLYINKSNNSNMIEVNPYILDEVSGGSAISMGIDKAINNEIELMKSELVLDKVIKDNNIVYKKKFGIIPNKKEGEYLSAEDFYKKGKILKIDNTKNTNVITIEYKAKKPEVAYGVVSSLITHYIDLHKEINMEKSKSDKKLLEAEYAKAKETLDKSIKQASGLPAQSLAGIGNLSAMSVFSKSASQAIGNIKNQYVAGEKSQIAVNEESQKLIQLATRLEWAKMVEQMSDTSKVLVLKEPKLLRTFENTSPKLLINIILGCMFGYLLALLTLIYKEQNSKKLTYSMLTNNIIFNGIEKSHLIENKCCNCNPKKVLVLSFVQLPNAITTVLQNASNTSIAYYDGTNSYISKTLNAEKVILISKIGVTETDSYKMVRETIQEQQKELIYDVLL